MKFLDFFSGIGGGRHGLELAGHECIGFCEADKYAIASYTSMYLITQDQREYLSTLPLRQRQKEILKEEYRNGEWFSNDITKLNGSNVPKADIWCFGAPCQSFSVAGRRAGLDGQSGLIREIFRLLREIKEDHRPEWLIYENVKGMLSSNKGFDYLAILTEMDELGYDCQWDTLNSKDFGVPQNRERVYTLGHLRTHGGCSHKIFPLEGTAVEGSSPKINILAHYNGYRRNTQTFDPDGITEALSTCQGGGREHHTVVCIDPDINVVGHTRLYNGVAKNDKERIFDTNGISSTMRASDYKDPQKIAIPISNQDNNAACIPVTFSKWSIQKEICVAHCLSEEGPAKEGINTHQSMNRVVIPVITPERINKRQNGRRFKDDGDPSFTLTAQDRHGVAIGIDMSANEVGEIQEVSHCLNANDQRKVFGANQKRTMGAVLINGDPETHDGIYVRLSDDCIVYAVWYEKYDCYIAIRKLTPRECFRLQGFSDELFSRAEFVNSDSQLYKQAGNAITVTVMYEVGKRLNK